MRPENLESLHRYLHKNLDYDPRTGIFTWHRTGQRAGSYKDGYRRIKVLGKRYRAGRLAWFYCFGEWPAQQIDHIDRVKDNDRLSNLREATPVENCANKGPYRTKDDLLSDSATVFEIAERVYIERMYNGFSDS